MWDEAAQEAESVDYLSKAEVKRMFELANDRDHAGTSDRIITYKKMEELWLEMSADGKARKQHGREKANSMVLVRACLLLIAMGLGLAILQIISANKCPGRGSLLGC